VQASLHKGIRKERWVPCSSAHAQYQESGKSKQHLPLGEVDLYSEYTHVEDELAGDSFPSPWCF
jgi:hypothetical protein